MEELLSQKAYKALKQEVVDKTALGVGYFEGILEKIPEYALFDAIRTLGEYQWIHEQLSDADLHNMLVTESIKQMNYQDFKEVAPYLFSFPLEQKREYFSVQPIEISRKMYDTLQANTEELMVLKDRLQQVNDRLDTQIIELETDKIENGDRVIGRDEANQTLLLLRHPENASIDDWVVTRDHLITNYRSSLTNAQQTVAYLMEHYASVRPIVMAYVMDNELYRGFADVPKHRIDELDEAEVPDFNTHHDFYDFATRYASFEQQYPTFEAYVIDRYTYLYSLNNDVYLEYADKILEERQSDIAFQLDLEGKELVVYPVSGFSQGEHWELSYVRNKETETRESVEHYLEHEIGAWYRGSLTEVAVIPLSSITVEKGYDGTVETTYILDSVELPSNSLSDIQQLYPELEPFSPIRTVDYLPSKQHEMNSPSRSL